MPTRTVLGAMLTGAASLPAPAPMVRAVSVEAMGAFLPFSTRSGWDE